MKKLSKRIQRINEAATQVRQVIESAPARVEHLREAVASTTLQLQKLRSDITSGVASLRAETDPQLLESLREIDSSREILKDAGAELRALDLDLGPNRRLLVELRPNGPLDVAKVRSLASIHANKPALKALLEAIPKCQHLAEEVSLETLAYRRIVVEIGLIPSVRMGWSAETARPPLPAVFGETPETSTLRATDAFTAALDRQILPGPNPFAEAAVDSPTHPAPANTQRAPDPVASGGSGSTPVVTSLATKPVRDPRAWSAAALTRFKKMPDLGRA